MMDYQFSQFESTNSRLETRITVTQSNTLGFPTQFYKDNKIKDYRYVVLYYDRSKNAIGIRFTNDDSLKGRFSIGRSNKYGGGVVALSFFKSNNIDTRKYRGRYEWKKIPLADLGLEGDDSLYVIELRERTN